VGKIGIEHEVLPSGVCCVHLTGILDIPGVNEISLKFTVYTATYRKPVIVNLQQVTMITSTGVGMLIAASNALRAHKVPMVLFQPQPSVEKVILLSGLQQILPIEHDLDAAIHRLGEPLQA